MTDVTFYVPISGRWSIVADGEEIADVDVDEYLADCAVLDGLVSACGVCEGEPVQRQAGAFADRQRSVH